MLFNTFVPKTILVVTFIKQGFIEERIYRERKSTVSQITT